MSINGSVSGDKDVGRNLGRVSAEVRTELIKGMGRITLKLMRESVQNKLSGQVLKRVTGTLARAVTQSPRTYEVGANIVGTVGVADITGKDGRAPVKYGRMHEYGFTGPVTVKEHLRLVKKAFGKPLKYPVYATVKAHTANVNLPERSFLRSALRDLNAAGVIDAEIEAAIAAGTKAMK
jgi:hypothetical protein